MNIYKIIQLNLLYDFTTNKLKEKLKERYRQEFNLIWFNDLTSGTLFKTSLYYKNHSYDQQKLLIDNGDINNWDISILCGLLTSYPYENVNLLSNLKDENKFISIIKSLRDNVFHSVKFRLSFEEFEIFIKDLTYSLIGLGYSTIKDEINGVINKYKLQYSNVDDEKDYNEQAEKLKNEGNDQFNLKNYRNAITIYSNSIALPNLSNKIKSIIHSNRSKSYIDLYEFEKSSDDSLLKQSEKDALVAIDLDPKNCKWYFRLGKIYFKLKLYEISIQSYEKSLAINPLNKEYKNARDEATDILNKIQRGESGNPLFRTDQLKEVHVGKEIMDNSYIGLTDPNLFEQDALNQLNCAKGHFYMDGTADIQIDHKKAAEYFKIAHMNGYAEGTYNLALCYQNGTGVSKDIKIYFKLLNIGATKPQFLKLKDGKLNRNLGVAESQHSLGLCYESGIGVDIDLGKAYLWYEEAVKNECSYSFNNLGVMVYYGKFGKPDRVKGRELITESANRGNFKAMQDIANIYFKENNLLEGYDWLKKAADGGLESAIAELPIYKPMVDSLLKLPKDERDKFNKAHSSLHEIKDKIYESKDFSNIENLKKWVKDGSKCAKLMLATVEYSNKAFKMIQDKLNGSNDDQLIQIVDCLANAFNYQHLSIPPIPSDILEGFYMVFDKVLSNDSKNSNARICKSNSIGIFQRDFKKAIVLINEDPNLINDPYLLYHRSVFHAQVGNNAVCLDDISKCLKLIKSNPSFSNFPNIHSLYYMKFVIYSKDIGGRTIQAFNEYLEICKIHCHDHDRIPQAYYLLAHSLLASTASKDKFDILEGSKQRKKAYENLQNGVESENLVLPCCLPYESYERDLLSKLLSMESNSTNNNINKNKSNTNNTNNNNQKKNNKGNKNKKK